MDRANFMDEYEDESDTNFIADDDEEEEEEDEATPPPSHKRKRYVKEARLD